MSGLLSEHCIYGEHVFEGRKTVVFRAEVLGSKFRPDACAGFRVFDFPQIVDVAGCTHGSHLKRACEHTVYGMGIDDVVTIGIEAHCVRVFGTGSHAQ